MNGYLLDTNVLSEIRKPRPDRNVVDWLDRISESSLYVSCLSLGEIRLGIERLEPGSKRDDLERWLDVDVARRFDSRVLAITNAVAQRWGRLEAVARRAAGPLPIVDALLAATALHHELTMVTRNVDDFARSRTPVVNPWLGSS